MSATKQHRQQHITRWYDCQRCPLGATATRHVLYRGSVPCKVLFVGEAPGLTENVTGTPFIGQSGKLLDELIRESMPRTKKYTFCVSNILACAPWTDETEQEVRIPEKSEIEACRPRLLELIELCKPRAIVTLGKTAEKYLPSSPEKGPTRLALVHPSFILRKGDQGQLDYKRALLKLSAFLSKVL